MSLIKKIFVFSFVTVGVSCSVYQPPQVNNPLPPNTPLEFPSQGATIDARQKNLSYPFDLVVDTIAFMDCPGALALQDPNFFAFKFASYFEGIKLSKPFLNNVTPYTAQEINTQIRNSPHLNTKAQIGFSARGNPESAVALNGTGKFYGFFYPLFSHPAFVDQITTQYKASSIAPNRDLEAIVPITRQHLPTVKSHIGNNYIFTLTYSKNDKKPIQQKPGIFYGKTYDAFLDGGENGTSYLEKIEERNLSTNEKSEKDWDCPENLRFLIHRHRSLTEYIYSNNTPFFIQKKLTTEGICLESNRIPKQRDRKLLERVLTRSSFTMGETHIFQNEQFEGTGKACIVPKDTRSNCYAGIQNMYRIEFDENEKCTHLNGGRGRFCPSYLSVCVKR